MSCQEAMPCRVMPCQEASAHPSLGNPPSHHQAIIQTHLNASIRFFIRSPPNTRNRASSRDRKNLRQGKVDLREHSWMST